MVQVATPVVEFTLRVASEVPPGPHASLEIVSWLPLGAPRAVATVAWSVTDSSADAVGRLLVKATICVGTSCT